MAKEWEIITRTNFWGNKTYEFREKKDTGGGCLVLLLLIVAGIVFVFTSPYKLIDAQFKPFEFNWLKDINIWLFCCSTWIAGFMLIVMIKAIFTFSKYTEDAFALTFESPFTTIGLFVGCMSIFAAYLLKARMQDQLSIAYPGYAIAILIIIFLFVRKAESQKKGSILFLTVSLLIIPYIWINSIQLAPYKYVDEVENKYSTFIVNAKSGANLRESPSRNATILTNVKNNTSVEFLSDSSYSDGINWYLIKADGYQGWMSKKLLIKQIY